MPVEFAVNARLPIYELEPELPEVLAEHRRLVIQAPTGSGKSTQIPQMLVDRGIVGDGRVVVLQPRRLATRMLARRVASERRVRLGDEVGYQIRFEDESSSRTRIKYETEGVLLRQMITDPTLPGVAALVFDEFHERHVYGDVTLARALDVQRQVRPDLNILVMSATLDVDRVIAYLEPCSLLISQGRTYPVTQSYLPKSARAAKTPPWELAASAFERVMHDGHEGDALVFMPGAYEITRTVEAIRRSPACRGMRVLPLHGQLSAADQDAAVMPCSERKVVVATNVAETSITIDGVRVVIDSGLARVARYDPHRGINMLLVERISQAAADQRSGRAGRTAPGHTVRLWTEQDHGGRARQDVPEIKRIDLSELVLNLKASGWADPGTFPWLEEPEGKALARAEQLLRDLGAADEETGAVTQMGRRMIAFPVHPRYARMLIAAGDLDCVSEVALIAAITQGRPLLMRTRDKAILNAREHEWGDIESSDFFVLMRAWQYADRMSYDVEACRRLAIHAGAARQVVPLYKRFLDIARRQGLQENDVPGDEAAVRRCVLAGFSDQLGRRRDQGTLRCDLVHGRVGELARESVVRDAMLFVASEIREVQDSRRQLSVLLTLATVIEEEWLHANYPAAFHSSDSVELDRVSKRIVGYHARYFRDLALERRPAPQVDEELAARLLADEVEAGRCPLKKWDRAVDQYLGRIVYARGRHPEAELPDYQGDARRDLLLSICRGARSLKEVKEADILPRLKSDLRPDQQALVARCAPEQVILPGGRKSKVIYDERGRAKVAARIQDLYGVDRSISLPGSKVPVTIEVLAPNHRPVQITDDLQTFWKETYPRVKAELAKKYPKHEWK